VNFAALGDSAREAGLRVAPLATQGAFLTRLGINERAAALTRANPGLAAEVERARDRLTSASEMGDLFKVFCAHSAGIEPQGFA
jgi:SAM-dependent MidA family methyltransferase